MAVDKTENYNSDMSAVLTVDGSRYVLPVYKATAGAPVIDIRDLYSKTGFLMYDPGYTSTAACRSSVTYVDGENGRLLYRGYSIEELASKSNYLEVAYLLINGELPTQEQFDTFNKSVVQHTMLHEQMVHFWRGFRRDAHPMAAICGVVGALASFYHDSIDIDDPIQRNIAIIRMIAKMPTIVANAYKYSLGHPFMYPRNDLMYAENFLYMCFAVPCEDYKIDPVLSRAMDLMFMLHADHEQNASTSTVRLSSSSGANPFACLAAGIACLWGPAHGGANEACLNMLREIGTVDRIPEYVARAKDRGDPFRLMGFGHRVYKSYDPRARVLKEAAHDVLSLLGSKHNNILQVACELEHIANSDDYFIEKKLYPNVDFYSGLILEAIGFPTSMFTAIFAAARTVGWIAQWLEQLEDPEKKIGRPRQLYAGNSGRKYVEIGNRSFHNPSSL